MSTYSGPVDFLDPGGIVLASGIQVHLEKHRGQGGLLEWHGRFGPIAITPGIADATGIRLPDGNMGQAFVTGNDIHSDASGATQVGRLSGSGPAPF